MADRTIVGVDFSGAQAEGKTWVTKGRFDGKKLTIKEGYPRPMSRTRLEKLLKELPDCSVATMDFPFGVPREFAKFWLEKKDKLPADSSTLVMPDLWQLTESMEPDQFRKLVDEFTPDTTKEYLRVGDLSESASCLHRINPNMVPMTFQGMRMLHRLCSAKRAVPFEVPPLKKPKSASPVLLEVMPGSALRVFGLPYKYKSKQNKESRARAREKRIQIFDNLQEKAGVKIPNLNNCRETCIDCDDCLDSVVAAIVASLWAMESKFCYPSEEIPNVERWRKYKRKPSPSVIGMTELDAAKQEGWIYVPRIPHKPPPSLRPNC